MADVSILLIVIVFQNYRRHRGNVLKLLRLVNRFFMKLLQIGLRFARNDSVLAVLFSPPQD